MIESINPATGATLAEFDQHTPSQLNAILDRAAAAQAEWALRPLAERSACCAKRPACCASAKPNTPA